MLILDYIDHRRS